MFLDGFSIEMWNLQGRACEAEMRNLDNDKGGSMDGHICNFRYSW